MGTNFPTKAAILWNGAPLTTTAIDSNTLSAPVGSSSIATPATVQLQVQNTQTMQSSTAVPLVIASANSNSSSPLTISLTPLPQGVVSDSYSGTLAATGGTAPYTWSIASGQLPAGLTLAPNTGVISGTPTAIGNYSFVVGVADSSSSAQSATATVSLTVGAAAATPLTITSSSSLPSGTIGSAYSNLLQASGGAAPYTWSITAGALPAGLSLAPSTGIISGTPTATGTAHFTAVVADSGSPAQTTSVAISLVIAPATLTITTSALPSGTQSSGYSAMLQSSGGTGADTWSITSGTLPAGLSLNTSTGQISGTPTASGNVNLGVMVKDAGSPSQTSTATIPLSIVAAGTPLAISSTSLPAGTPNQPYSSTLNATGGTAPYTWSITSGTLPAGLTFATSSGTISGTPTASGTSSLTFKVIDVSSPAQSKSVTLSIAVAAPALAITTSSLPSGTKGSSYSSLLQASGGTAPYTWSVTAGSLPAGLSLDPSTGLISGTPTATGTSSPTITLTDKGNPAQTQSIRPSITIAAPAPPALTVATSSLPSGTKGTAYSNALQASGGTTPYAWSITAGSLPAGLTLTPATGLISGTPTATGTANFTATVTDGGSPAQTKSASLSIAVAAAGPAALTISAILPSGTAGTTYSNSMTATGGTPAYTWSITAGSLPAGLTLAATTGVISGTPSASGTFNFTATVTDNGTPVQTQSAATSIVVAAVQPAGSATNWYVRPDGGTRYDASAFPSGQCDGKSDAAYPSGGLTNQHCAFNDYRYMYDAQNGQPDQWIMQGGDTLNLTGCAAGPNSSAPTCRIGWDIPAGGYSSWCEGYGNCTNPTVPSGVVLGTMTSYAVFGGIATVQMTNTLNAGDVVMVRGMTSADGRYINGTAAFTVLAAGLSASQFEIAVTAPDASSTSDTGVVVRPTRILGKNFASCNVNGTVDKTKVATIFGGWGLATPLDLSGAKDVEVACLEITSHSSCIWFGSPALPNSCSTNYGSQSDFDSNGIQTTTATSNVLLQDLWIHGHTGRGIKGPIGGVFTAQRVDIAINGAAGWDFDDGSATPMGPGAIWNFFYSTIEWSGCNQEYPAVDALPVATCYSQSTGGYGDGVGTPAGTGLAVNIDHSAFIYNTQDGLDLGHVDTGGPYPMNITNSIAYSNSGGTFKWGPNLSPAIFTNNVAIADCMRMHYPITGTPSAFNANLSDFCRANDAIPIGFRQGGSVLIGNNTVISYAPTTFDIACWDTSCTTSTLNVFNNIIVGYDNPAMYNSGGQVGGPGLFYFQNSIGNVNRANNLYYGIGHGFTCPTGFTGEKCASPGFVNQPTGNGSTFVATELDNYNFHLAPGSPAAGAGGIYANVPSLDYFGVARPNPPSIGAVEP